MAREATERQSVLGAHQNLLTASIEEVAWDMLNQEFRVSQSKDKLYISILHSKFGKQLSSCKNERIQRPDN